MPAHAHGPVLLQEHLFLVCELLRANLYEFQKYNADSGAPPWFTLPRVQAIASHVLRGLAFLHSHNIVHFECAPCSLMCDLCCAPSAPRGRGRSC